MTTDLRVLGYMHWCFVKNIKQSVMHACTHIHVFHHITQQHILTYIHKGGFAMLLQFIQSLIKRLLCLCAYIHIYYMHACMRTTQQHIPLSDCSM